MRFKTFFPQGKLHTKKMYVWNEIRNRTRKHIFFPSSFCCCLIQVPVYGFRDSRSGIRDRGPGMEKILTQDKKSRIRNTTYCTIISTEPSRLGMAKTILDQHTYLISTLSLSMTPFHVKKLCFPCI